MKNIICTCLFFIAYIANAADTTIWKAADGPYEAEQFIVSQYLATNLRLTKVPGKRPLVMVLGGSEGGCRPLGKQVDSMLKRGYHVLQVGYWGYPLKAPAEHLPNKLSKIRLESFWEEISKYLNSDKIPDVIDEDLIGIMGVSKGGELALLLASHYPQFKFVVGLVPSHVVFQASNTTIFHHSSWTLSGQEVPFVPYPNFSISMIYGLLTRYFYSWENVNFTWMHRQALKNVRAVEQATIKVENINGPILLVSGKNDQWWPSSDMSNLVMNRLKEHNFAYLSASSHLELETDHDPFRRQPLMEEVMLDRLDEMLRFRQSFAK